MYLKFILTVTIIILAVDTYYYRALIQFIKKIKPAAQKSIKISYWLFTFSTIVFMFFMAYYMFNKQMAPKFARVYIFGIILIILVSKAIGSLFLIIYDLKNFILFIKKQFLPNNIPSKSRRSFLKNTAIIASAIPFGTLMFGVIKSAFDFTVRKQPLKIPNLPTAFQGLKIVQISDIHIGSFLSDEPIKAISKLIKEQNADVIFFTGDLVNEITEEALPFIDALKEITAPLGVYSILGNHDYGDYFYQKDDIKSKKHNYQLMQQVHQKIGWKLLLNENHIIEKENQRLAILGVENWGALERFPKLGDINKAKIGTKKEDVKLLLSHDPSHWEAHVIPDHSDIAVTFSGHTHGMQFGIEIPGFKWSPSKYMYKYWAGLYKKSTQQIYTNRGLGFIGYPGRVGILPEITVFELS